MDRISLTWLIYGVIAACIAIATTQNLISTKVSTAILSLYGVIGIILVFTVRNRTENFSKLIENFEKHKSYDNTPQNTHDKQHPSSTVGDDSNLLDRCDTNIQAVFNPVPYEPENNLIGTANDPLPEPGIDFRSTPPGPYATNQLAYKFNIA